MDFIQSILKMYLQLSNKQPNKTGEKYEQILQKRCMDGRKAHKNMLKVIMFQSKTN